MEEINSLNKLLNLKFQLDYYDKKYQYGRPYDRDVFLAGNTVEEDWVNAPNLDFWNYDISINEYKLLDAVVNCDRIEYSKYLSGIIGSFGEEIESFLDNNYDQMTNNNFLVKVKRQLKHFLDKYYNIQILDKKDGGIWHNSVVLIPNVQEKHYPEIDFNRSIISSFLKEQKEFVIRAISLVDEHIELTLKENHFKPFGEKSIRTTLQWKKSDTDLLELIVALNESGSIFCNNSAMSRKQTIEFFENLFGITIKDAESKLSRATNRNDVAPYLLELKQTFENYSKKKLT